MGIRLVHRPARLHQKIPTVKPIQLAQVPVVRNTSSTTGMAIRVLLPIVGGIGMVLMMFSSGNPIRMVIGSIMLVVVVTMAIGMYIRSKTGTRKQAEEARERFLEHLEEQEPQIIELAREQRQQSILRNPEPIGLTEVIRQPHRLWERRLADEDFLIVRLGVGTGRLACGIESKPSTDPMTIPEPLAQAHLDRMIKRCQNVDDLPIAIPLHGVVSLVGEPSVTANAVRALLIQAAVFHAPDDLRFHLALPLSGGEDNGQWALWLPHILDDRRFDGPIGRRGVSVNFETSEGLIDEIAKRKEELSQKTKTRTVYIDRPHLVVVVDMESAHGQEIVDILNSTQDLKKARITIIATTSLQHLEPGHVDVRISFGTAQSAASKVTKVGDSPDHQHFSVSLLDRGSVGKPADGVEGYPQRLLYGGDSGIVDTVSIPLAEAVSRELSPLRLVADAIPETPLEKTIALDRLLDIADFRDYDIAEMWQPRTMENFLNVPFGVDAEGKEVKLDIKESALNGMGPHGLCVGATGSGKSEVLRTIVLGQAICHPPELLSLVLVDYKGGATFAGLEALPHTAAIVDNLEDGSGLVDRLHDAILGEIQRRQKVLQESGNLANVGEYHRLRKRNPELAPLPHLFVVIDEFGELLAAKPDFVNLFVQIGRIGRSIGMHLLLASQRLEEGRLRGLESYLSYRLGLRTFSAQESRSAIGSPDAHELPPIPGSGLLKVDPDIFDRFKAAYVSGPYLSAESQRTRTLPPVAMPLELLNTTEAWLQQREEEFQYQLQLDEGVDTSDEITLDIVVDRLRIAANKTRQIWLPPLPNTISLNQVLGPATLTSERGLSVDRVEYLTFTFGVKDKPLEQWQGPLSVSFLGSNGNGVIIGSPQSGKTTTIRTLVLSAALTHMVDEVNFFIVDMAGSGLKYLEQLPHVSGVATRLEVEKLNRLIAEVKGILLHREELFSRHNIDNAEHMRELRNSDVLSDDVAADVFLIIDGWNTMKKDFDALAEEVHNIAQRGLGYGIHVIFTSGRWADLKLALQAVVGTKIELKINDAMDSMIGKKFAQGIDANARGRALTTDTLYNQICMPHYQNGNGVQGESSEALVAAIASSWHGKSAPPVRLLPELITYSQLREKYPEAPTAIVGLNEANLGPVHFDLDSGQRLLLIIGDRQSGKTSTLRTLITEYIKDKTPNEALICLIDLRRNLLGFVPNDYIGDYAGTQKSIEILVEAIRRELERRQPPADITFEQLKEKSWWEGPDLYLIVDDYELIEGSTNPLRSLIPYFSQAGDIGFHMVFARRSAGMNRTGYESVLQAFREAGANGLLLSGDRQEGQVWPGIYMQRLAPGRGLWVDRSGQKRTVQLAFLDK